MEVILKQSWNWVIFPDDAKRLLGRVFIYYLLFPWKLFSQMKSPSPSRGGCKICFALLKHTLLLRLHYSVMFEVTDVKATL